MATIYCVDYTGKLLSFSQVAAGSRAEVNDANGNFVAAIVKENIWDETSFDDFKQNHKAFDVFRAESEQVFQPHWHDDAEKRLIVQGTGRFYVPLEDYVLIAECSTGDMIEVEAGVVHWFFSDPSGMPLTAIRFFKENTSHISQTSNIPETAYNFFCEYGDIICATI